MEILVYKVGGALLDNQDGFDCLYDIVKQSKDENPNAKIVIVISAFAKVTAQLADAGTTAETNGPEKGYAIIDDVINFHKKLLNEINKNSDSKLNKINDYIDETKTQLLNIIKGVGLTRELTPQTKDTIMAFGEKIASTIVANALEQQFGNIELFDITTALRTNNHFGEAVPDIDATDENLKKLLLPLLENNDIIVTQGFIAATNNNNITTMGYESSNNTAAIIAGLLKANKLVFWTDTEGIREYDPKIAPKNQKPRLLEKINYDYADLLANNGLKLIPPKLAQYLRLFNIEAIYKSGKNITGEQSIISSIENINKQKFFTMFCCIDNIEIELSQYGIEQIRDPYCFAIFNANMDDFEKIATILNSNIQKHIYAVTYNHWNRIIKIYLYRDNNAVEHIANELIKINN